MTEAKRRRWSFRTRLTVALAAIFAASGAVLVFTQYVILDAVFSSTAMTTISVRESNPPEAPDAQSSDPQSDIYASVDAVESVDSATVEAVTNDVLGEMMLWSLVLIAVFALAAWFFSWFVVRRAMSRVHQVSETARRITDQDLAQRLNLPGPDDEIKELGDTIDSMLVRLQSSFEAQSRFIANASHELRTPLTATRLTLEVPLQQNRVADSARPIIERALKTTRRSEKLVESLLTLARDPATLTGEAEPVDLSEIVTMIVDEARKSAEEQGIAIKVEVADCVVDGNADLLRQLVENLIDNAIAHNRDDGTIEISLIPRDRMSLLEVGSTGTAIDPDQIHRLRQPFERDAEPRVRNVSRGGRPGIGLGLSIVDSIATAHRGTLALEAKPGGGLIATVSLPIARDGAEGAIETR